MKPTEFSCPICRRAAEPANQIFVCAPCHGDLVSRGQVQLTSTSEFAAMSPARAAEILGRDSTDSTDGADGADDAETGAACSWCGKSESAAKKLLSNRGAHICNECVALCADIMSAELGDDWR